jgi:NAD(P)-dependent dehydrogenase (short-subunit alcohol dehydrogenase family)
MDPQLKNRTALVTGGTSGIGLAIAQALADEGVHVAVVSRRHDPSIVDDLKSRGVNACAIEADLSREPEVRRMFDKAAGQLGGVDLYVNNAARAVHQPVTQIDAESAATIVNTNLMACVWGAQCAARHMIARGRGAILIVGSTSMYTPGPTETVYRMTKSALKPHTVSLAVELAPHNIRVNLLVPGYFRTRLTAGIAPDVEQRLLDEIPLRRPGDLHECAAAAVFLLSDALSGYTTAAELLVDGGIAARPLWLSTRDALKELNNPQV